MEILYVIAGGGMVALGFMLANMGKKAEPEVAPEPKPEPMPEPQGTEELPKSGVPIAEQVDAMMSYDPHKALKNGDKT